MAAFGTGSWGGSGMARIHAEAGADAASLGEALTSAVVSGDSVLGVLVLQRSEECPAAWHYLSAIRT